MAKRNKKPRAQAKRTRAEGGNPGHADPDEIPNNPFAALLGTTAEPASKDSASASASNAASSLVTQKLPERAAPGRERSAQPTRRRSTIKGVAKPPESGTLAPEAELTGKLVVRREKAGRGGKTVTRLQGLRTSPEGLQARAQMLAKALGTRAWVEDSDILVAGDQTPTLPRWLEAQGATRVIVGN